MSEAQNDPVARARRALALAQANRVRANTAVAEARRALATAPPDDEARRNVNGALQAAVRRRLDAAAAERSARSALASAVGIGLPQDPSADAARLDARVPIAFFPLRLETRFDVPQKQLLVRVYPDEILADGHEPELTSAELADGQAYWTRVDADAGQGLAAWQALLANYAPERAAWLVRATTPDAPAPALRPETWTRAVSAPLLPDRFVVLGYRAGKEVVRAFGSVVLEPLALTVGPDAAPEDALDVAGDGTLVLDDRVVWTVDFERAVAAGMAVRVPLADADLRLGFDRLLVFGLKTSLSVADTSAALAALLDAQHYTRGLAFVKQGTPSNNGADGPSAFPPVDPDGSASYRTELGAPLDTPSGDGVRFARALGLDSSVVAHIDGADRVEQAKARAMNRVLFPATLGYFLEQMMQPVVTDAGVDQARSWFVEFVRGRGALPLFRVGNVPYGLLVATSLARYDAGAKRTGILRELPALLRTLLPVWSAAVANAPRVGRSADADADLLDLLAMDASTREVRIRRVLGQTAQWNLLTLFGIPWTSWGNAELAIAQQILTELGHPEWSPRVLTTNYAETAPRFAGPLVAATVSEADALNPDYMAWIRTAGLAALRDETLSPRPNALLYKLVRHGALVEVGSRALQLLVSNAVISAAERREPELVKIAPGTEARSTVLEHLARPLDGVTGQATLFQHLAFDGAAASDFWPALAELEGLPTAELERLLGETLDTASHRIDAWVSSLATERLATLRERTPQGSYFGAWGWVEGLRPASDPVSALPDGRSARTSPGGYVHAPSMTHAAAAAVLRSAHLTHYMDTSSPFAIDLSSARSRAARQVLEAVRNGQPVGAVLGYGLERGLHERLAEPLIAPLRKLYPLPTSPSDTTAAGPAESVAARNVVDGLRARTAFKAGQIPYGSHDIPDSGTLRDALDAELRALDTLVDAVADGLLAESVFQVVRGNTMAASATLDALAAGSRAGDPEVLELPTAGVTATHRVLLVWPSATPALGSGWPAPTPRATAEPRLDAWLASVAGDPTTVSATVSFTDAGGTAQERPVTAADLGVRPLDLLYFASAAHDETGASELDRRVAFAAAGDDGRDVSIRYAAPPGSDPSSARTFPELFDVLRAFERVLGRARPLTPVDLLNPAGAADDPSAWDGAELLARAEAALGALQAGPSVLGDAIAAALAATPPADTALAAVRTALRGVAAFGLAAAFPNVGLPDGSVDPSLLEQATSVRDEAAARAARAVAARPASGTSPVDDVAAARAMLSAVFGPGMPVLAGFRPTAPAELDAAHALGPVHVGDATAPERWLQQLARVRAPLAELRKARLLGGAFGSNLPGLGVAQLPNAPGAQWIGLPLRDEADRVSGRCSLALLSPAPPAATDTWFGVLLDEWVETLPNATEQTAIGFQVPDPGAEAPQAVLLAVAPSVTAERWDFDTVTAVLNETLELAKIRAVDGELLGALGQILPTIFLSANGQNEAISTRFTTELMAESVLEPSVTSGGGG
jgi:hypothetical protein